MPGHDTSSFVSRDRGLAEVIDGRIFAPQSGFGECRLFCGRTLQRPRRCRTPREPRNGRQESRPSYGRQENQPYYGRQKITPMRRLTVNRKPLRNHGSLAQPPTSGNGLYSTAGHLVEFDRFLHGRRASRQKTKVLPCLTAGTASSPSPPIPSNT